MSERRQSRPEIQVLARERLVGQEPRRTAPRSSRLAWQSGDVFGLFALWKNLGNDAIRFLGGFLEA
jgi:hypothetical protein